MHKYGSIQFISKFGACSIMTLSFQVSNRHEMYLRLKLDSGLAFQQNP